MVRWGLGERRGQRSEWSGGPRGQGEPRGQRDQRDRLSPLPPGLHLTLTPLGTTPTGQARSHPDLNLQFVTDCTQAIFYPIFGGCSGSGNFQDENGHGTHVAGIAAAKDNEFGSIGTAPNAALWSVKVIGADGTGFLGAILAGIDFVTSQAQAIEVANMSLGFIGTSAALDTAISNSTNAGVTYVVAAGNDAIDAAQFSPAAHPDVITVSALADFDGLPEGLGSVRNLLLPP